MLPSQALQDYLSSLLAVYKSGKADSGPVDPALEKRVVTAEATLDQAIYDMARRAHLGLPMVDEPRKKRGA